MPRSLACKGSLNLIVLIAQGLLALGCVGAFLYPRAGEAIAVYPIATAKSRVAAELLSDPDVRVLGTTRVGNALVIQSAEPDVWHLLFEHGVIMISIASAACTPVTEATS